MRSSRPTKDDVIAQLRRDLAAATKRANEVPGLSAAFDEARCGLEQVRDNRACNSQTCGQIAERVLSGKMNAVALRVLAERVPLLEAVATGLKLWRDLLATDGPPSGTGAWIAREIDSRFPQLAALDKKGTTDGK